MTSPNPRLYIITDPSKCSDATIYQKVNEALAGGAGWIQYRDKRELTLKQKISICQPLALACEQAQARFVINDDVKLAKELHADLHIGQSDTNLEQAKAQLQESQQIGVTCHQSIQLAKKAFANRADYISLGAFFPSHTKPQATRCDIETLAKFTKFHQEQTDKSQPLATRLSTATLKIELKDRPQNKVFAIGGIQLDNFLELMKAGAYGIAVCNSIWEAPCIRRQCEAFTQKMNELN